jgi:DNA-binding NarL/FixJ family response regulator
LPLSECKVKGRILVADDDELFASTMERALMGEGYQVRVVPDAHAAVHALGESNYDALIADIHMPGNEELQLLDAEELVRRHLSVVLVTGKASVDTAVHALNREVDAYLRKPFRPQELFDAVDRALRHGRQKQLLARLREQNQQVSALIDSMEGVSASSGERGGQLTEYERQLLSEREHEVLDLIASGLEAGEVARKLFISPYTVRNHMKAIYKKLGVNSHASLLYRLLARPN